MMKRVLGLIVLFSISPMVLWSQKDSIYTFIPKPTGSYSIGTQKIFLADSSRNETLSRKVDFREIYVKIWYPISQQNNLQYCKYLNDYPDDVVSDIFSEIGVSHELIAKIKENHTHSFTDIPIISNEKKYPVIIFNPGYYFGMPDFYTSILENLASNGYIVCCVNHPFDQPYVESGNGEGSRLVKKKARLGYLQLFITNSFQFRKLETREQMEKTTKYYLRRLSRFDKITRRWVDDTHFFIDYLNKTAKSHDENSVLGKMDLNNIGTMGHSIGGAVAGQLSITNRSVKAGINIDCFQFGDMIDKPLEIPFMLLQSEYNAKWNLGNEIIFSNSKSNFYKFTLKNATHFAFSDVASYNLEKAKKESMIGKINGPQASLLVNEYILQFFNHYLLNMDSPLLQTEINNDNINFIKPL